MIDIPRNDLDACLAYYKQCKEAGTWSSDKAQSVATLHDDPDVWLRALNAAE